MDDFLNSEASQSGFAELVGVSRQAIQKQAGKIGLKQGETYRQWLRLYVDQLRTEAAGRARDNDKSLGNQKLKESEQKTLQLAIANSKELGHLVPIHEMGDALNSIFSEVAGEINNAGTVIQERLESELSTRIDDELIFKPLSDAAASIANVARKCGEGFSSGGGPIDSALATIHS
ncbi:MAG: hypothetical protein ACRBBW_03855 [Cellvibrionaceae bacterium]